MWFYVNNTILIEEKTDYSLDKREINERPLMCAADLKFELGAGQILNSVVNVSPLIYTNTAPKNPFNTSLL